MQANGTAKPRSANPGIRERHSKTCSKTLGGKRCSCEPSYEVVVSLGARGHRRRKTLPTLAQAKAWRAQMMDARKKQRVRAPDTTLRAEAEAFLEGMRNGAIVTRSGAAYRPSVIRNYDKALSLYVLPDLGGRRLADVTTVDLQRLVERLRKQRLAPSTIRSAINPVRAIFRRAVQLGMAADNPTLSVSLPTGATRRIHAGDPASAARMIAAVEERDQCAWALAYYGGLRLGELRALRWSDVDLDGGVLRVRRSWDPNAGEVPPKSNAGRRDLPILHLLRPFLAAQQARCEWSSDPSALVLGKTERTPFGPKAFLIRSTKAWDAAKLPRVTPHQARHSFASFLIAAGANAKELSTLMGHGSARISLDTYSHLFDGAVEETAGRVNAWLAAADTGSRVAQLEAERQV